MKKSDSVKIAPELLLEIDLSNSINGGSSEVQNWLESVDEGYQFTVNVPGVAVDDLTVEVIQGRVVVYYPFPVYGRMTAAGGMHARVIGNFAIPVDGDYERVSASYTENTRSLKITVPFNEQQKGFRSKVLIDR